MVVKEALGMITVPSNIEVQDLTESLPPITIDAERIKRVFVNIIKNAVEAMPEGGKLTLKSEKVNDRIRIEISDNGEDISEENQKKLFQPLFTTKESGIGFGLAICKRIVEAHKGKISVKSAINAGTTFTVDLPLQNDQS